MIVLFQSIYLSTPHYETELELMKEHIIKGDKVYVLHCKGELKSCFANFKDYKSICYSCQRRFKNGIKFMNNKVKIINYPLENNKFYNVIPDVFENIEQLKLFKIGFAELGICTASSLITAINKEHLLDTIIYKDIIAREINNAYYVYLSFKELISNLKPDLVYLFNGRFSTVLPALNACEEMNINYITHERGGKIGYYTLYKNTIPHNLENISSEIKQIKNFIPEAEYKSDGCAFFEDRRKRIVHSWWSFTKNQIYNYLPENFNNNRINITFFNTTIEEYAAIRCWKKPIRIYKDEIDAICNILDSFSTSQYHFYLRVHPNLTGLNNSQTQRINSLKNKYFNLTIIPAESKIDSYALMDNSNKVITFGSTTGVEACYWGIPSILLGIALYKDLDCCYIPRSHEEVINLLNNELIPKSKNEAILYGYWELNRGYKFKYFNHTDLNTVKYNDKTIDLNIFQKILFYFLLILDKFYEKIFKVKYE